MKTTLLLIFSLLVANCSEKKTNKANLTNSNSNIVTTKINIDGIDKSDNKPKTNEECAKEFRQSLFAEQVRTPCLA